MRRKWRLGREVKEVMEVEEVKEAEEVEEVKEVEEGVMDGEGKEEKENEMCSVIGLRALLFQQVHPWAARERPLPSGRGRAR